MKNIIKENLKYILSVILVIPLILVLLNMQNMRYLYGKVPVSFNSTNSALNYLTNNPTYGKFDDAVEGKDTIYITQSTDSSTNVRIISKGALIEEIDVEIDTTGLTKNNIQNSLLNDIEPVLTAATTNYKAIEVWALSKGLIKAALNVKANFSISKNFRGIKIYAASDSSSDVINIKMVQNASTVPEA